MGKQKKIMIAGTFDLLHPGHIYLINEASKLGRVYVVVGTDKNVERFKGKKPVIPEKQRLMMIQSLKNVEKALLGYEDPDLTKVIEDIKPDIILLGPDQTPSDNELNSLLAKKGLNIKVRRLKRRKNDFPLASTSKIIQKIRTNDRINAGDKNGNK
ncbi:MAG: adenylyltransferase/cytidyltransferase family protein [Promethearchaeota archaeon]